MAIFLTSSLHLIRTGKGKKSSSSKRLLSKVEGRKIKSYHLLNVTGNQRRHSHQKIFEECLIHTISSTKHWDPKSYTIFVAQSLKLSMESKMFSATLTCRI